jgi:hypothetical protein
MSQRASGYERKERDLYETPAWVTEALVPHLPRGINSIWEPACGGGKMLWALVAQGYEVDGTDIADGDNFLDCCSAPHDAIVTNPPYELATEFVQHALDLTEPERGVVAMLLRTDFDHAKTRYGLFGGSRAFAKKLVLTKRIKWFEDSKGQPSFNHAWFIWDWKHSGPPVIAYGPEEGKRAA